MKAFAFILAMFLNSPAAAEECFVSAYNKVIISGDCSFKKEPDSGGIGFSFTSPNGSVTAQILKMPGAPARAGIVGGNDRVYLGEVTPIDACWTSDIVKICAWLSGERAINPQAAPLFGSRNDGTGMGMNFGPVTQFDPGAPYAQVPFAPEEPPEPPHGVGPEIGL